MQRKQKNRVASGFRSSIFHFMEYFHPRFPRNAGREFIICSSLITLSDHFTSLRCCRGLPELPGSFSRTGVCASDGLFTCASMGALSFFLSHSLNLLTLNLSISITFDMARDLFKMRISQTRLTDP